MKEKKEIKDDVVHDVHKATHPLVRLISNVYDRRKIVMLNNNSSYQKFNNLIFACNHSNSFDVPTNISSLKRQFYVVAGDEIKKDISGALFSLNGVIWVDRNSKKAKNQSKQKIIEHLKKGHNILIFPEGTWNVTESNLMLPLYKGVIDASIESGTPIVPVAIEYLKDKRIVNIGDPYFPLTNEKSEAEELRDKMATLRWIIWESLGIVKRKDIEDDYYEKYLAKIYGDYPKLQPEYEKGFIRKEYVTEEEVFEPIRRIRKKY